MIIPMLLVIMYDYIPISIIANKMITIVSSNIIIIIFSNCIKKNILTFLIIFWNYVHIITASTMGPKANIN